MAIADAIASGFDSMHAAKQQLTQKRPSLDHHAQQGGEKLNAKRSAYASFVEDNTSEADGATATVLSRASQLSELISRLDASDVVECYVVTRMAPLANAAVFGVSSTAGGIGNGKVRAMLDASMELSDANNATTAKGEEITPISLPAATPSIPSGPVLIRKSALAFRYRPRVASASAAHGQALPGEQRTHSKYFELTLEYGPQRAGAAKTSESIPVVRMDTDSFSENSNIGKYVSWENEGRVYHCTQISEAWTDAYYMAPISGVVFEKIIQRAVEYTSKRPRYQPFEVVSIPSGNLILRSSGSDDFVWDMFHDLADLYVVIDPLLVPPRDKVQFYVADPDRTINDRHGESGNAASSEVNANVRNDAKQVNPNVQKVKGPMEGSRAAVFYENFFNCANAIKTGDYSSYVPPPSFAPTDSPTSIAPSMAASIVDDIYSINNGDVKYDAENVEASITGTSDESTDGMRNTTDVLENNAGRLLSVKFLRDQRLLDETNSNTIDEDVESNVGVIEDGNDTFTPSLGDGESLSTGNADDEAENSIQAPDAAIEEEENNNAGRSNNFSQVASNVVSCLEKSHNISCCDVVENEDDRAEDSNEVAEKAAIEAAKAAENAG